MLDELKEDLVGIDIRFDEPLKRYTYTKVGGPAVKNAVLLHGGTIRVSNQLEGGLKFEFTLKK